MAKKQTIRPKAILEDIESRVLKTGAGQKPLLSTQEELLYAILKVLVYDSRKGK